MPDSSIGTYPLKAISNHNQGSVPIRVIPTGPVNPAKKRDIALNYAQGEILAFLDDDAYPKKDWLKNALKNFQDEEIAAVGGPAITCKNDNLREIASGVIYSTVLVSGKFSYRYTPKKRIPVDDYPSCNFLVRKSAMLELGGFQTNFWPGEDTKLCLEITKKLGRKIIYDPTVLVYHHRRPLYLAHLRQVTSYACHRGYFVKRYPVTSLKILYFTPSIFLFALFLGGILTLFITPLRIVYFLGIFSYLILVFIFSIFNGLKQISHTWKLSTKVTLIMEVFVGIILTHLGYGLFFLKGLFSKKLKEEV